MTDLAIHKTLEQADREVAELINKELERQQSNIELIASENFTSLGVMEATGSCLTNKYAEGYPGKRYYNGCEHHDKIEALAIERAKELFNAEFANVQAHSGASANLAVFLAALQPGDKFLGMSLKEGGHLTHGCPVNISGKWFEPVSYGVNDKGYIDYEEVLRIALAEKPKLIIAGASAYPREIDFAKFRAIADEVGALLMVDMAHIAGLVAGGVHPSPVPYADFVTTTTHKTLRGPRGGLILTNSEEWAKKIDSAIFPGAQGGPLMHVIAAKAVCFKEALEPEYKEYQAQVAKNSRAIAAGLMENGVDLVSGGTDNHLCLLDLSPLNLTGKDAANLLDEHKITVNKNGVPNDPQSPFVTSGIRIGASAITSRGFKEEDCKELGATIAAFIKSMAANEGSLDSDTAALVEQTVTKLTSKYPLYPNLSKAALTA